jgi:DNA transposition AAA+ family ATPase
MPGNSFKKGRYIFLEYMAFWNKYNFKMALHIKTRDLIQATLKLKAVLKTHKTRSKSLSSTAISFQYF